MQNPSISTIGPNSKMDVIMLMGYSYFIHHFANCPLVITLYLVKGLHKPQFYSILYIIQYKTCCLNVVHLNFCSTQHNKHHHHYSVQCGRYSTNLPCIMKGFVENGFNRVMIIGAKVMADIIIAVATMTVLKWRKGCLCGLDDNLK